MNARRRPLSICAHGNHARVCYTCELEQRNRELADQLTAVRRRRWMQFLGFAAGALWAIALGLAAAWTAREVLR